MKRRVLLFFWVLFLTVATTTAVRSQQVFKTTSTSVIAYLEYLPEGYQLNSDKYPVVIFLHGIGERGTNTTDINLLSQSILKVDNLGPPLLVKDGHKFPFILISPQLKDNHIDWPSTYVMEVIDYVKTYLRIDEKRIYLTGLSLGGGGAWWTAQDYPELFAALAPVCGGRNDPMLACEIARENLPVWAFHGDKDTVVPLSRSVTMVNAINGCQPSPVPQARMTIYAGVGHDSWDNAFRVDHSIHDPNVYEWMLSFTNAINKGNRLPVAQAGDDKTLSGTSIYITGSGTDADGTITSYSWTQLSGAQATLTNKTTYKLYASGLKTGKYVFSLRVTDNAGGTDTDYVTVTIGENQLPVAQAGADITLYWPTNTVKIYGRGSDADGTIANYLWSKVSGPEAGTLADANTPDLILTGLAIGSYVLRLTVTDDKGGKHYDEVTVVVKDPVAPVANAGPNLLVLLPTNTVAIQGTATDHDGNIASYKWTQRSGPVASITGTNSPTLNVSGLVSGIYKFRFLVTDDSGLSSYDDMLIRVTEPPEVDAGPDQTVFLPTTQVSFNGSAVDPDGTITKYAWSKYSGPGAVLMNANTPTLTVTGLKEGTYTFMLRVTDNSYAKATDYVTLSVNKESLSAKSQTSGSSTIVESAVSVAEIPNSTGENPPAILNSLTDLDLEGGLVTVFNEAGDRIYSGNWSSETYHDIFTKNGLYLYQIIKKGKRINAGKIYIRR